MHEDEESKPLDSGVHESHLTRMSSLLSDILKELKGLRKDVQELTAEISHRD
jgi:hypothetical protein